MITIEDVLVERQMLRVGDTVKFYTDKYKARADNIGCKYSEGNRLVKAKIVTKSRYGMELDNGEFVNYKDYLIGKLKYEFFH